MSATTSRSRPRLFVAMALPDELRRRLTRTAATLVADHGGTAVPAANLHVTLAFLGSVGRDAVPDLCETARDVVHGAPVRVRVGAAVPRPSARRARLIAVELDDVDGTLAALTARVRRGAAAVLGTPVDARVAWPHVTVVRFSRPTRVRRSRPTESERVFDITRVALYDSDIAPGRPPTYHEVLGIDLGTLVQRSTSNG